MTSKLRKGGLTAAAAGLAGMLAMSTAGCDTVAQISFSDRNFQEVHTSGFVPATSPSSAQGLSDINACKGTNDRGDMKVRFVLRDNKQRPIRDGEVINGFDVAINRSNLSFDRDKSALMEPSVGGSCSDDESCGIDGFSCGIAPGSENVGPLNSCYMAEQGIEVTGDVDFLSDLDNHQVFGVLMENTGSLEGYVAQGTKGLSYDSDHDGITDIPFSGNAKVGRSIATDSGGNRYSAISDMKSRFVSTRELAKDEGRRTFFGMWTFNGGPEPSSLVEYVKGPEADEQWTDNASEISSVFDAYTLGTAIDVDSATRANVYQAAKRVIEDHFSTDTLEQYVGGAGRPADTEKVLVLFVDGPDDMRNNDTVDIDDVIKVANQNEVRLFVVHLDPAFENPSAVREDMEYYSRQEVCTDDSTCKSYETCRRPKGYSEGAIGEATQFTENDTYCMPNRHVETGRIGPIQDYAQLACATGGGYMYVPSAQLLAQNLRWLPYTLEGLWEATVNTSSLASNLGTQDAPLMVQTDMSVSLAQRNETYSFNQSGSLSGGAGEANYDDFDTRGVIFYAPAAE